MAGKGITIFGWRIGARSNCKEEFMCGEIEGYPCVKATTLHRETKYAQDEAEYKPQLRRAVARLRPTRDENGVGCAHPLLLESRRQAARGVLRRRSRDEKDDK